MGVTITTVGGSVNDEGQRHLDRDPNTGQLWAIKKDLATLTFWYSDNDGANWSQATGNLTDSNAGNGGSFSVAVLFVDLDGGLNVAYNTNAGTGYRRGVVSGTSIAWSSLFTLPILGQIADLVAFRHPSGTGWMAAVAGRVGSGDSNFPFVDLVRIIGTTTTGAGVFQLHPTQETSGISFGGGLDFHHIGDGKTVQGGTPHLYAVSKGVGSATYVSRLVWNGSGYSPPITLVGQSSVISTSRGVFDGSRLIFTDHNSSTDVLSLYERDAGNTATVVRAATPALAAGISIKPDITYDRVGNVYAVAVGASDSDLWWNVWTRATDTWGTWTLLQTATATGASLRRGWAGTDFPTIEGVYKDATNLYYQEVAVVNAAPSAPSVLTPGDGLAQDVAATLGISWQFNDPDQGDSQSAYSVRRRIGTGAFAYWNGSSFQALETAATKIVSSAASLGLSSGWGADADADHFYSVKTWDSLDQISPWSTEQRVIPSAKDNPTITDPVNDGDDVTTASYTVVWTAATQTKYRIRVIGDSGGTPNPAVVDYDSGMVNQAATRSHLLTFPVNSIRRQIELTTWNDEGLASTVVYRIVDVAFTPPNTPTMTLSVVAVAGAIQVTIDNPAGGVAVGSNDLFRRIVGETTDGIRVATGVVVDGVVVDYAVASGVDYEYRTKAIAGTGATAFSAWVD
jgi:hypothetical protein